MDQKFIIQIHILPSFESNKELKFIYFCTAANSELSGRSRIQKEDPEPVQYCNYRIKYEEKKSKKFTFLTDVYEKSDPDR